MMTAGVVIVETTLQERSRTGTRRQRKTNARTIAQELEIITTGMSTLNTHGGCESLNFNV